MYDWEIKAEKALLRYFSFIMKPIFSANHHWAMEKGEESLKLELARLHAASEDELVRIPEKILLPFSLSIGRSDTNVIQAYMLAVSINRVRNAYLAL